jgi:hypothetical protein
MEICPTILLLAKRVLAPALAFVVAMIFAVPLLVLAVKVAVLAIIAVVAWMPLHSLVLGREGWWSRTMQWRATTWDRLVRSCSWTLERWLAFTDAIAAVARGAGAIFIEVACGACVALFSAFAALGPGQHLGLAAAVGAAAGIAVCIGRRAEA